MKKTLLASAILASLVSVSAQAATVYDADGSTLKISGDVDVTAYSDDSVDGTIADASYASINLFGTTKVSDTVTAYAEFEIDTGSYNVDESTLGLDSNSDGEDDSFKTSEFAIDELLVGFDTAYGDFSFGGTSSALGQISDFTDVGNEYGGGQEVVYGKGATGFAYSNTFSGVTLNVEYIASSDEDADSAGISAVYSLEGLSFGLGYVSLENSNELALGLGYSVADLYVGFGYAMGEKSATTDFTAIELAAQYSIDAVTITALMGLQEEETGSATTDTTDFYSLEVGYSFASNVSATVGYMVDNIDNVEVDSQAYAQVSYDF